MIKNLCHINNPHVAYGHVGLIELFQMNFRKCFLSLVSGYLITWIFQNVHVNY